MTIKDRVLIFQLNSEGAGLVYELESSQSLLNPQKFVQAEAQIATATSMERSEQKTFMESSLFGNLVYHIRQKVPRKREDCR